MPVQTDCLVWEGFSNRLNSIASTYLAVEDFTLWWAVNSHCPVPFEFCFDDLCGVEPRNVLAERFPYSLERGRVCWYYLGLAGEIDPEFHRKRIRQVYAYLLRKMKHRPSFEMRRESCCIQYRHHIPEGGQPFDSFKVAILQFLDKQPMSHVLVMSDDEESVARISRLVIETGRKPISIPGSRMDDDLDRSPEIVSKLCQELILASQCSRGIISNSDRSSVSDSAKALGIPVLKTFSGKDYGRNHELENLNARTT